MRRNAKGGGQMSPAFSVAPHLCYFLLVSAARKRGLFLAFIGTAACFSGILTSANKSTTKEM